jgi:hypothetical protein
VHPEFYSGKHKMTGMKVQVACTIYGLLAWISDSVNGSSHDNYGLGESGVLLTLDPENWVGDKPPCISMRRRSPLGSESSRAR